MNFKRFTIAFLTLFITNMVIAQMVVNQDTLYGNEWIEYDQSYFKIMIKDDGIYRIPKSAIPSEASTVDGDAFQIYHNGREIPLYVTNTDGLSDTDYIEFYGKKNRSEIDEFLFINPETELLNPYFSLFNDTSAYYLTWNEELGKRYEEVDEAIPVNATFEQSYTHEQLQVFGTHHTKFYRTAGGSQLKRSNFELGEGWATNINSGTTTDFVFSPNNVSGGNGELTIQFATKPGVHNQSISINGTEFYNEQFTGYQLKTFEIGIPNTELTSTMNVQLQGTANDQDRQAVAFASLKYQRNLSFAGANAFQFSISSNSANTYLEITDFNNSIQPVLYDITNGLRIETVLDGELVKVALPPSSTERQLILVNPTNGVTTISVMNEVDFIDYNENQGEYIIVTNEFLRNGQIDQVQAYADYRASNAGGNFETIIVDIQQVYEQFGYGINRHNIALRNFYNFAAKNWDNPRYTFILGKGREYKDIRTASRVNAYTNNTFFVPTFGTPGGDNLLTADNWNVTPKIAIGRIAAKTPDDIGIYLSKIQQHENNDNVPSTIADRAWMKKFIHLGGGNSAGEQNDIKNRLSQMQDILEQNEYGGEGFGFFKTSTDPIQIATNDALFDLINSGVSMITFFGHSGTSGFDFSVENLNNFTNEGKYPIFFSLGCYSGQIHSGAYGVSEQFVLAENKASIAFGASASFGLIPSLSEFGKEMYRHIGQKTYGQGIGDAIKGTISTLVLTNDELLQQFTLHGDPALKANMLSGPDFTIDNASLQFEPGIISSRLEDYDITFDVANLGRNNVDSVVLEVKQRLPDNSEFVVFNKKIEAPANSEEISINVPMQPNAVGQNFLFAKIDADNQVDELPSPNGELNNDLSSGAGSDGFPYYITSNDLTPVYPREFSIINDQNLTLKTSTTNPFLGEVKYLFEIDTSEYFNSPMKVELDQTSSGGMIKWQPSINYQDDIVYYWRVSPDSISESSSYIWQNSSFLFKQGIADGWNQSHFFQYQKDGFINMNSFENQRNFKYIDDVKGVLARNSTQQVGGKSTRVISNNYDAVEAQHFPYFNADFGLYIMVMDSLSVEPWWTTGNGEYGTTVSTEPWELQYFAFETDTEEKRNNIVDFLDNVVPENNYVFVLTIQANKFTSYYPEQWAADSIAHPSGRNIFNLLEEQGATSVRSLETIGSHPYILAYKKDAYKLDEALSMNLDSVMFMDLNIAGSWDNGRLLSTNIGPAASWNTLEFLASGQDVDTDEATVNLYGVKSSGSDTLLVENIEEFSTDISDIDAIEYPFLKLEYISTDTANRTAAQLDYWRVFYRPLPEAALNPLAYYEMYNDTLQQGELFRLSMAVENIDDYDMDSLLMKYTIANTSNELTTKYQKLKPLLKGDTLIANMSISTKDMNGLQTVTIEANPDEDQPERAHFNNIGITSFRVGQERINPVMDVTFDGVHILDGDIVSPKPFIVVSLEDENKYLELGDTSLLKVLVKYPGEEEARPIAFASEAITFIPANPNNLEKENRAQIEFRPEFVKDSIYQLIVQAKDVTGNSAGQRDYKVNFEIVTKSTISNILNYPNPFSTSTRFVYTLTGLESPTFFKIQIYNVSGRIVKEITQDELGPMKIGTHRTEYAWDGTDEFGDRLANGVYLYRIIAQNANGEDIEMRESSVDSFFNKGFGKMVLIR